MKFQWLVRQVPISESVTRYAVDVVRATRPSDPMATDMIKKYINFGSSVRASMNLVLAGKAYALMQGRYHVTPDDIKTLALPIMRHRVLANYYAESDNITIDEILTSMLNDLAIPAAAA